MESHLTQKADASGDWKIIMPTPSAGGPYLLKIKGNNVIELKDVLIGEVWVCSGQSNMAGRGKITDEYRNAGCPDMR